MNNYSTLIGQLKRNLLNFTEKICEELSRPGLKFISKMLYGLLKGQSVMLTDIARSLEEEIALKKTVERISRNLTNFKDRDKLIKKYTEQTKSSVDDDTIFCLDPGEITKKYSRKQENLGYVWDASEKKIKKGYKLVEVTALSHGTKLPIPVYSELFASDKDTKEDVCKDEDKQLTAEILKAIKSLNTNFGSKGILTADRGMDNKKVYKLCVESRRKFVVRAKVNRNVIYKGEKLNILDLAKQFKGKITLNHTDNHGKNHRLKMWHVQIELPDLKGVPLTLIIVHGYDKDNSTPMLLITNLDANGKNKSLSVLKIYLCRWRIEEYYRFKKVQFSLENIRVMSFESIKTLHLLVSILSGYIALFATRSRESQLLSNVLYHAKRIYGIPKFMLYAVADGIFGILSKATTGISSALKKISSTLKKKSRSQQLSSCKPRHTQ